MAGYCCPVGTPCFQKYYAVDVDWLKIGRTFAAFDTSQGFHAVTVVVASPVRNSGMDKWRPVCAARGQPCRRPKMCGCLVLWPSHWAELALVISTSQALAMHDGKDP